MIFLTTEYQQQMEHYYNLMQQDPDNKQIYEHKYKGRELLHALYEQP